MSVNYWLIPTVFVLIVPVIFGLTLAQQTPTIVAPTPAPNLQFVPQPAYIQLSPSSSNNNNDNSNNNGNIQDILVPTIISLAGAAGLKLHSDKKTETVKEEVKDTKAEVLKGKEVDKEIAKVAYAANPTESAKIEGVPLIKTETLAKDATEYATKTAKT